MRTQKKSDTTNDRYPQTPSRVQFSVWPAGVTGASQGVRRRSLPLSSRRESVTNRSSLLPSLLPFLPPSLPYRQTIDWAGGMIDWNASEYTSRGYFATYIKWISIDCYSGSDLDLPYVASNQSSNSTSSRMGRRDESSARLWERANTVNSYVWGGALPFFLPFHSCLSLLSRQLTIVALHSQRHERTNSRFWFERRNGDQLALLDRSEQYVVLFPLSRSSINLAKSLLQCSSRTAIQRA